MGRFTAGAFVVKVYDPHPCQIQIERGEDTIRLNHREIADLQFALERARQEAMRMLGDRCSEVL